MADCSTTVLVVLLLDWAGRSRACSSPARDACAAVGVSWQRLRGGAGPLAARLDDGAAEAEEAARARRRELRRKRQQRKARRLQESFKVCACMCPSQAGTPAWQTACCQRTYMWAVSDTGVGVYATCGVSSCWEA